MSADAGQSVDLGADPDLLSEQLYLLGPFIDGAAQGAHCLISDKEDRRFLPPQVMLQMVADPAGFTHAAGRKNHLRTHIKIDCF